MPFFKGHTIRKVVDGEARLDEQRALARAKGGRLRSTVWLGWDVKLEYEDKSGNVFWSLPNNIRAGRWSPYEAKQVRDPLWHYADLVRIVDSYGGKVVSKAYMGSNVLMEFEDAAGRRFWVTPSNIKRGSWSPYERGVSRDREFHYRELVEIARSRGGKVISSEYVNSYTPMEFEDAVGNRFWAEPRSIKRGIWNAASGQVSEHVCRQAMQFLLGMEFPSAWNVVKRPNGNKLQLDGWNATSRIAFEYQGYFHNADRNTKIRDSEKAEQCRKHNIILVVVSEFNPKHNLESCYIIEHVAKSVNYAFNRDGLDAPVMNTFGFKVDLSAIELCVRELAICRDIAASKEGFILSDTYVNSSTPLICQDKNGRMFSKRPSDLKSGSWSPYETKVVSDKNYPVLSSRLNRTKHRLYGILKGWSVYELLHPGF